MLSVQIPTNELSIETKKSRLSHSINNNTDYHEWQSEWFLHQLPTLRIEIDHTSSQPSFTYIRRLRRQGSYDIQDSDEWSYVFYDLI
jgi:hypothetical protein